MLSKISACGVVGMLMHLEGVIEDCVCINNYGTQ
jgi:hypothetical protein